MAGSYGSSGGTSTNIKTALERAGLSVRLTPKKAGSRVNSANELRTRLENTLKFTLDPGHRRRGILFFDAETSRLARNLRKFRSDPKIDGDIMHDDDTVDDHGYDALRYGLYDMAEQAQVEVGTTRREWI